MTRFNNFTDEELDAMESAFYNERLMLLVDEIRMERMHREDFKLAHGDPKAKIKMYIACKKCKYNHYGECNFYDMGSGNKIDMPCYREKEEDKKND